MHFFILVIVQLDVQSKKFIMIDGSYFMWIIGSSPIMTEDKFSLEMFKTRGALFATGCDNENGYSSLHSSYTPSFALLSLELYSFASLGMFKTQKQDRKSVV